jgi:probable phosphoglycerate mutase
MSDARVYLIRHGEAMNNIQANTIAGQALDAPLTDLGTQQASNLGLSLRRIGLIPDVVYTSTARRAIETGHFALAGMGLKADLIEDERLLEQHTGDWTGSVASEIFTEAQVSEIEQLGKDFRSPNGESMNDVGERMFSWLTVASEQGDGIVFAFTHGGAIRALASYLEDWTHERTYNTRPDNVSLSVFGNNGQLWVPEHIGAHPDDLDIEMIDPMKINYLLSENELIRSHLQSVIWFGSRKNKQDVHARSDFDVQIVLDQPSTALTIELNRILKDYPNVDLSIMYMKDIVDKSGKVIFHDGTKGLFFMQVLAEGKILYGDNIYADLVTSLDLESIRPSLMITVREYLSRLRVMAALSPEDTQEFKKYSLKMFKDILLFEGITELSQISRLDNASTINKVSNRFDMGTDARDALDLLADYEHTFSPSQVAALLTEYEMIVEDMCNE